MTIKLSQCEKQVSVAFLKYEAHHPLLLEDTQAVAVVQTKRYDRATGEEEEAHRFYICTVDEARRVHQAVRSRWQIENQLHWVLDVAFGEDGSRRRQKQATQNAALATKTALNLLKRNEYRGSIRSKGGKAVMNTAFRESLLFT